MESRICWIVSLTIVVAGIFYENPTDYAHSTQGVAYIDLSKGLGFQPLIRNLTKADTLSLSNDGSVLAVQNGESILTIDTNSGAVTHTLNAPKRYPGIFAISPDGKQLVSSDATGVYPQNGSIYVWNLSTSESSNILQKERFADQKYPSSRILFAPDGKTFSGTESSSSHYSVDYWSSSGPKLIRRFSLPDNVTTMWGAAFSPSGNRLLVGSWDGALRLWDVNNGSLVQKFTGHTGPINQVKFASNGERIVSTDNDTIKVWNTGTGELLVSAYVTSSGEWLEVTPEGFFDASPRGTELLSVVRGLETFSIDQFFDALHRQDLIREKLAGDREGKVRQAASKLDLNKVIVSGSPPQVAITSPQSAVKTSEPQITSEVTIADQGGGIGKVEWRVNGTTVGIDKPADTPPEKSHVLSLHKNIALSPGTNRIEVVAYNAQGLIVSDPSRVTVELEENAVKTPPALFVMAIGINEYWDSRLRLEFAAPDARSFAQAMNEGAHGLYEDSKIVVITDNEATSPKIDKAFADLSSKVRPQDVFVLFMAGHGKTVDGRFYFIPQEFRYKGEESVVAGGIGQDQLQQCLGRIPARKSILLFDACESGTLTEDQTVKRGMEEMTAIDRLTRAMGRSILTATTDDKPAMEGVGGHGVFTYALLNALSEAQRDADGFIDVLELASYVDRRVPEISYDAFQVRQVPQTKIVGSNFPLAHPVALQKADELQPRVARSPTHVVIRAVATHDAPSGSAATKTELTPGTQLRLVETKDGWALVAREGAVLGYVDPSALALMH